MTTLAPPRPAPARTAAPTPSAVATPAVHRFTVEQYHRMFETGVLEPGTRTELIDGILITMAPFLPPHVFTVTFLTATLSRLLDGKAWVSVQNSLRLNDGTEPEPDIALLRTDTPTDRLPGPANTLLVIEIAVTTEALDRNVKLLRYAEAGIPEAWLVLPEKRTLETFRRPGPGGYTETALYTDADTVDVLGASLVVADAFPPAAPPS